MGRQVDIGCVSKGMTSVLGVCQGNVMLFNFCADLYICRLCRKIGALMAGCTRSRFNWVVDLLDLNA